MAKSFEFIFPLKLSKGTAWPCLGMWECCLGTKCGCLIPCGLQGDNPVSPEGQRSPTALLPPQLSLTCPLAGLFLYLFSLRPGRKTSPGSVLPVLQCIFGTGCGWWEPAVSRQPLLPSPLKLCTGGAALSFPKLKKNCFSNLMLILKAGIQRKEGWPWKL